MMDSVMKLFTGLYLCRKRGEEGRCKRCPYTHKKKCVDSLLEDALAYVLFNETGKEMVNNLADIRDIKIGEPIKRPPPLR
jgi:hypothetical protein